jgi:hypothetical protein
MKESSWRRVSQQGSSQMASVREKDGTMKRITYCGLGLALCCSLLASPAGAQSPAKNQDQSNAQGQSSSGSSLGDYARQVRKDGGPSAKARPKVFDNDNLPREDKLSVIGEASKAPSGDAAAAKPAEPGAAAPAAGEAKPAADTKPDSKGKPATDDKAAKEAAWKQWQQKLASQREQIALLQRELDVLQREYQIRAAAFYADAGNRLRNSADWDKSDTQYKQQIADKTKAIEDAKQKLEDTEEEARKAGVPAAMREQ